METSQNSSENFRKFFRVFVDDDGVLNCVFAYQLEEIQNSEQYVRMMKMMEDEISKITKGNQNRVFNVLVSGLYLNRPFIFDSKTVEIVSGLLAHKQADKFALVYKGSFVQAMLDFIVLLSGRKNKIKFFSDETEAKKWLMKE